ncbi:MAG: Rne/Rng family ribonuclease [Desulfovibrio sp.]|uniref:Rne/Rng family ribonuclease n=1 Tax=Desulfovibrio sp. TaxID=885 RepID=UPI00135EE3F7|nr:Rne/Rng family ribonuclease [Desulfovibrio sp.]MTJ93521.1 Rne/Rng family ribonuclease [Desulfovibrio sp.]
MTTDQDTPVAASQPATDTSSQEVSKPKRTPTTRKAKAATKPAAGKSTAKSAGSAPTQEPQEAKATPAPAATPKTSASKTATAKATSRSAGKTTKTAAAKSKKTATTTKEISTVAAEATGPASAAAADAAPSATPTAKSTAKTATSRSTSRGPAARKPKRAAAHTGDRPPPSVSTASPAAAEVAPKAAAPKTAKAPKGRSTAAKGSAKAAGAKAKTEGVAARPAAEPVAAQPSESRDADDKSAKAAGQAAQQTSKPAAAAAPADVAKAAPEKISDKPADRTPRQDATPAAPQTDSQEPRQQAEQTAETSGAPAAGDAPAGDSPRRKNRRGRRGGRGRNRKKDQSAQNTQDGDTQTSADALNGIAADGQPGALADDLDDILADDLNDDADSLDLDDDLSDTARESRPRQAPRQGKQPGKQAESGKTADGKASDTTKGKGEKGTTEAPRGKRRMFISVLPGEQVEVALAEDGQLLEYYLDMLHQRKIKGNIYKGVIHNIDTNLQAAFVSYGAGKNGFLQIDEVHPEYWLAHHEPSKGKKFPPIQKVLKAGQEVLVQVVKEPTGSKGAFLTTWLSLAGRFLVLTPGQDQIGVSRKVDDDDERARLREMMNGIDPGQGLGVIVRTVSAGTTKTTLKNDLQYLKRVWRDIRKKATEVSAPSLIYQEPGLSERAVRDYLTEDVCEIWVDNEDVAQSVRETVNLLFPRRRDLVRLHTDMRTPMWERFNLRRQLEQIYSREVLLPSGGRLVFDQTEALMAIDINSGKISGKGNFEAMAHKTNMEAADAIARHLKLRDIGGQVVIDFIEMRDKKHVLEVEKTLRTAMKNDRARHDVSRMSSFGLLELVRQRTGSSALAISLEPCPACGGTGMRRNIEWQALQALRELRRMMSVEPKEKCVYSASPELALYLLNHKRDTLREIEQDYGKCLEIMVRP